MLSYFPCFVPYKESTVVVLSVDLQVCGLFLPGRSASIVSPITPDLQTSQIPITPFNVQHILSSESLQSVMSNV